MAKKVVEQGKKTAAKATKFAKRAKKSASAKKAAAVSRKASTKKAAKHVRQSLAIEPLTHRLEALLHTMRCITQHEDELCTLLHDARQNGKVSAPLLRELQAVLDELPAEEYTDDLQAIRALTGAA